MIVRSFLVLACVLGCSISHAEEAVEIPLSEIWALNIPGTKDVHELEGPVDQFDGLTNEDRRKKSLVTNTSWLLSNTPPQGSHAEPGFVVQGTGHKSLREANFALSGKKPRIEQHPAGEQLTLVFFSHNSPRRIQFESVTRSRNEVVVKYRLLNPRKEPLSRSVTSYTRSFALIPIGEFAEGPISARIRLLPADDQSKEDALEDFRIASRIVCDSFTFGIVK